MLETTRRPDRHRHRVNPFELSDEDFRYKYRFSKRFGEKIVGILREDLVHDPRGCPLSPEIQVVCALRNWARHEVSAVYNLGGVNVPHITLDKKPKNTYYGFIRRFKTIQLIYMVCLNQ
ncbi:unnamed protein product [Parnassius mnemosyne]|uniref:Uncharacterized protein n=1 Tax=Parnassius mnemosyne TaxID=213953 RepID=A0AAV1LQM6_9NEOP